jgi:hypothetical protein
MIPKRGNRCLEKFALKTKMSDESDSAKLDQTPVRNRASLVSQLARW